MNEPTTTSASTSPGPSHGFNFLLIGPSGSGKTYSIRTLVEAGVTPFVLATEPGVSNVLGDIPPEQLHWHYLPAATESWSALMDKADKINRLTFEGLSKLSAVNKSEYGQIMRFYAQCNNFICQRTGEEFGDVAQWGPDRVLVVDSLSGLARMAMKCVVGGKPTKAPGEWGVAMDMLDDIIVKLCMDTRCHLAFTAHPEKERNEITGGIELMASSLGQKLSPQIPKYFDEVVAARREAGAFFWSTTADGYNLKNRLLPDGDRLPPSYGPLLEAWRKMGASGGLG